MECILNYVQIHQVWQAAQENLLLDEQAKQRDLMLESLSSRAAEAGGEDEREQTEAEESLASDPEERPVSFSLEAVQGVVDGLEPGAEVNYTTQRRKKKIEVVR